MSKNKVFGWNLVFKLQAQCVKTYDARGERYLTCDEMMQDAKMKCKYEKAWSVGISRYTNTNWTSSGIEPRT